MTGSGVFILCFFSPLWLVLAKLNNAPLSWLVIALGVCLSAVLIWLNQQQRREPSPMPANEQKRIGRVFMWSSIGEGVGIFVVLNILINAGLADRFMAGVALVVGLHFIPIGLKVPMKVALLLAAVLFTISVVGFVIPSPEYAALFVGCAGAITLWTAVVVPILGARKRALGE